VIGVDLGHDVGVAARLGAESGDEPDVVGGGRLEGC